MYRRHFSAIVAACLLSAPGGLAHAQDIVLTAPEVRELLTGNTAEGQWDGSPYRSYFGDDGVTIYAPEKGDARFGKWRIDPETGEYDSFWNTIGWTAYRIVRTEDGLAWKKGGKIYPFRILSGRRISQ